jgi:hypothetical protein
MMDSFHSHRGLRLPHEIKVFGMQYASEVKQISFTSVSFTCASPVNGLLEVRSLGNKTQVTSANSTVSLLTYFTVRNSCIQNNPKQSEPRAKRATDQNKH